MLAGSEFHTFLSPEGGKNLTRLVSSDLVALGTGAIVSVTWSLISPEDFDFDITRSLNYVPESTVVDQEAISSTPAGTEGKSPLDEKADPTSASIERDGSGDQPFEGDVPEIDFVGLNAAFKFALYWSLGLFTVLIIVSSREDEPFRIPTRRN